MSRFPTLAAWLDWQAGLNPREIELGLDRIGRVWRALGPPSLDAVVFTVAGTNGKGSSVAYLETMLQAAGYRVGCYTSPHLVHYNERIRVAQAPVDDATLIAAFAQIDDARGELPLTYFEFGTLAALWIFAQHSLDAVVLEVGLGGRLDAVNLIDADVALITAIGLDHQDWLGKDIELIGAEKAGIMRAGRPVVFSGGAMPRSVRRHADEIGALLRVAGEDYRIERRAQSWDLLAGEHTRRALPLPGMRGRVQIDNAAGAIMALAQVGDRLPVDQRAIRAGLIGARVAGRFEVRPGRPTWILDVAHNPQAAASLAEMLGDLFAEGRRIAVCGMLGDKDAAGVARCLAKRFDAWYTIDLSMHPRGVDAQTLARLIEPALADATVEPAPDLPALLARLAAGAQQGDQVVIFGSFHTVGEAMTWLDRSA